MPALDITVISAVYNTKEYLEACVKSLIRQTRRPTRVYFVDDGSTDGSAAILDSYAEQYDWIHVIHQENAGQAAARNRALEELEQLEQREGPDGTEGAPHRYVSFLDSDDWLDNDYLENLTDCCENEGLDVCNACMFDHYPDHVVRHIFPAGSNPRRITPSVCNKIFRLHSLRGLRFPSGRWYEDLHVFHRLLLRNPRFGCDTSVAYNCHCRPVSTMSNENAAKNRDILAVVDDILEAVRADGRKEILAEYNYFAVETLLITTVMRLAAMHNPEKKAVIAEVVAYVQERFPNWESALPLFPKSRRLVARLNARGLWQLSLLLIRAKGMLKHGR